ncbi:hypothetical protein RUND412_008062 [Rhizina undulata]
MGSSILFAYLEIRTIAGIQGAVVYFATSALPLLAFPLLVPILRKKSPDGFILTMWVQKRYGIIASLYLGALSLETMFLYMVAELSALQQVIVALRGLEGLAVVFVEVIVTTVYTATVGFRISFLTDNIQGADIFLLILICSIAIGTSVAIEPSKIVKYRYGKDRDGKSAYPTDIPSHPAGNPIDDSHLLGYGLAIAHKDNAEDVNPADFTIFSVNDKYVNGLYQHFEVPALSARTNGKCVCAWFWEGQYSANEMYMTGFECKVTGNVGTKTVGAGQPPKYCADCSCVSGPSNQCTGRTSTPNIDFSGDYDIKPSYNSKWGFTNGAQKQYLHWILCRWFLSGFFRENPSTLAAAPNTFIYQH